MCGRLKRSDDFSERVDGRKSILAIEEQLGMSRDVLRQLPVRYNIAPDSEVAIVKVVDGKPELSLAQWGIVRSWSPRPISNARADGVATKPTFKKLYQQNRCLLLADGYYEWLKRGKKRYPFLHEVGGGRLFAIAGLWESGTDEAGKACERCTLITTEPNAVAAKLHDRMPVILQPKDYDAWLDCANKDPSHLLASYSDEDFTARPVSTYVNDARIHEGPECIAPPDWDVEAVLKMSA